MANYTEAYIYNEAYNGFEDKTVSLSELIILDHTNDSRLKLIRKNLYCRKVRDINYKLAFNTPKNRKAYLRRINATELRHKGFSSECESRIHDACKRGIAAADRIKIRIKGKDYIIHKQASDIERIYCLMDREYETDCEYTIANIHEDLFNILHSTTLCFEFHHMSPVKAEKGLSYMLGGMPILEFDVKDLETYLPNDIKNEKRPFEDCVKYFKEFYENTEKHFISGTLFEPFLFSLEWNGNKGTIECEGEEPLSALVFKKNDSYRIIYIQGDKKHFDNDYFGKEMNKISSAKRFAEYRIREHLIGRKDLFK